MRKPAGARAAKRQRSAAETAATPPALALHGGPRAKSAPFGAGPKHNLAEWRAIKPVFARGQIEMTRGPEVMRLRAEFCRRFGARYAVTTSSGTAALHTALGAQRLGRGDEVITSPITDMGTLVAILQQNAVPVFADIDPDTLMITPRTVEAKLTRLTRAVIPVHLAGAPCDVVGIRRLTRPRGIAIVEDVAQSYLTQSRGRPVGLLGNIGCWSLNETKHIGAGDGGVLLTNRRALAERADLFADKCYRRDGGKIGPFFAPYNYRLNTLTAAVCLEQLKKVGRICARRHTLGTRLDRHLVRIPGVRPRPLQPGDYATYWYYVLHVDPAVVRTDVPGFCKALAAEGVPASPVAAQSVLEWPLFAARPLDPHACAGHCPLYRGRVDYDPAHFPGLQAAGRTGVRLPFSEHYTVRDIDEIALAVRKVAAYYSRRPRRSATGPRPKG